MDLDTQLFLGHLGNVIEFGFGIVILVISIPMVIWLVLSIVRGRTLGKRSLLKWWGIAAGIILALGFLILGYAKIFSGAAFTVASRINIYIPLSVKVLEIDQPFAIDEAQQYVVVQLNQSQTDAFIISAKQKGWKSDTVVPYALTNPSPGHQDPMIGRKYPLPKMERDGVYYSSIFRRDRSRDWYMTRMAYFLDVQTRILYVYYDDAQWG